MNKNSNKKTNRNIAISVGTIIVFVLIVISFIILPGMVGQGNGERPVFGKWGTRNVAYETNTYFTHSLSQYGEQAKQMAEQYGEYYADFFMRQAFQQAFNETIRRYAFVDFVEHTGYVPSENKIDRNMINNFLDQTGNFSEKYYRSTPEDQKEKLRKQLEEDDVANRFLLDYFAKDVIKNENGINYALSISDAEIDFFNKMNSTKTSFDAVIFDTTEYPDSEVVAYAQENPDLFNKYNFKAISVESDSIAKKVLQRISSEEITFEDAVTEYSKNYYSTSNGNLKNKFEYQITTILKNKSDLAKIADLKKDELSPVIQTEIGYTIFKCISEMQPTDTTNTEYIDVARTYVKENEMGRIQDYFTSEAAKFVETARASSFDSACKQNGKSKQSVKDFRLNFKNNSLLDESKSDIEGLEGISDNEDFLKKVFALNAGDVSDPIMLENAVVVVKANGSSVGSDSAIAKADFAQDVTNQDYSSVISYIYDSKKLKNNFDATYTKYFTSTK
ncbi:MAG: peptidylprolyl isomerase [Treponemataceae bacterium]|nr:peptidylprolyl isomerase [Treponemataceae bacterium]